MLTELNRFFKNIKNFRMLNEGVGESTIVDAINNHKYIYIYYAGDNTTMKGYRTIKPFVLGTITTKDGETKEYLRAWQEAGSSDSFAGLTGRKRADHEYHFDEKGRVKPGWRLFRVDGITSALPTGKFFSNEEGKLPPFYNPNDKQMDSIKAAVQPAGKTPVQAKGLDSLEKPDVVSQQVDKSAFDNQAQKFRQFFKATPRTRDASAEEIENLFNIAKTVKKKSPDKLLVVANEKGDMILRNIEDKDKLPPDSIVGNLRDLYNKFVEPKKQIPSDFFREKKNDIANYSSKASAALPNQPIIKK